MQLLTLGYSPCPNDTFIFYALTHSRIETGNLRFREILEDVETLNQMARRSKLDITKVSFHALGYLREDYVLLRSGGAMGNGCGPLVIAPEECRMEDLRGKTIAIPGGLTTAFLLLRLFDPSLGERVKVMPFHAILSAVKNREVDAGLIIHESRFTYQAAGLKKVLDLGSWWEGLTGLPIPLGGIIAKRSLGAECIRNIELAIRHSIQYAQENPQEPKAYISRHSQELDEAVIEQHIGLYVNNYSLDLGEDGLMAVREFFRMAEENGLISKTSKQLME
ncbi:MAG: 1,4-dihydroxy-6-naphthoate synthase [Thermodesulfovibrio sp.]|nr:1,4-dihydroxy-6-naphthoate synthase [Thermodesulfovibrio sp.]